MQALFTIRADIYNMHGSHHRRRRRRSNSTVQYSTVQHSTVTTCNSTAAQQVHPHLIQSRRGLTMMITDPAYPSQPLPRNQMIGSSSARGHHLRRREQTNYDWKKSGHTPSFLYARSKRSITSLSSNKARRVSRSFSLHISIEERNSIIEERLQSTNTFVKRTWYMNRK
jgi:hypothetical protein